MALLSNSIGQFDFIWLTGNGPEPPKMILSLDERPGVNGTEILREGTKGRPFTLRSGTDCSDFTSAILQHLDYTSLCGSNPVDLVQGGISHSALGYRVQVLDVRKIYAGTMRACVGGLLTNAQGYLECEWDLLAIEI